VDPVTIPAEHIITVDADPAERTQVLCTPFEPQFAGYEGEKLLSICFRDEEEGFVVLTATQAQQLAELLTEERVQ